MQRKEWRKVEEIKDRIKEILSEDAWGYIIRAGKHQEREENKAGLFHLNRERKNQGDSSISQIKIQVNENSNVTPDSPKVCFPTNRK